MTGLDAAERQAVAIKANPDLYSKEYRLTCDRCRKTIAEVYVDTGGWWWLWTPAIRGREKVPARAMPLTAPGRTQITPSLALCPKCRAGLVIFGVQDGKLLSVQVQPPTFGVVADG